MKSTKEGYRFLSLALLHTTNCFKVREKRHREAVGRRTWREADSKTAWEKRRETGRQSEREREGSRERKKVVASQLLFHDDLPSRHAVTDTRKLHLPLLDNMASCNIRKVAQKSLRWPENASQADNFTVCVKQKHTQSPLLWDTNVSMSPDCSSLSAFIYVCVFVHFPVCHPFICFVLFSVLSWMCAYNEGASYGGAWRKI